MEKLKLNSNHVNAKIQATILSDGEMISAGFTDFSKDRWYFCKTLNFPKKYKGVEITFNVSIPKDGSDISIDILDEDFLQPYDYQKILERYPTNEVACIVREQVELWMGRLQEVGVLSGHVRGEYI